MGNAPESLRDYWTTYQVPVSSGLRNKYMQDQKVDACKECGKPVPRSIEGEVLCKECWGLRQMSEEDRKINQQIAQAQREMECAEDQQSYYEVVRAEQELQRQAQWAKVCEGEPMTFGDVAYPRIAIEDIIMQQERDELLHVNVDQKWFSLCPGEPQYDELRFMHRHMHPEQSWDFQDYEIHEEFADETRTLAERMANTMREYECDELLCVMDDLRQLLMDSKAVQQLVQKEIDRLVEERKVGRE